MADKPLMALINLREAIHLSRYISEEKWFNREDSELGLNSRILRKIIDFIKTIPTELKSKKGIELYFTALKSCNMKELSKFYHEFISFRECLSESDVLFLEKFFLNKMDSFLKT